VFGTYKEDSLAKGRKTSTENPREGGWGLFGSGEANPHEGSAFRKKNIGSPKLRGLVTSPQKKLLVQKPHESCQIVVRRSCEYWVMASWNMRFL
jgi:hypothetical protein